MELNVYFSNIARVIISNYNQNNAVRNNENNENNIPILNAGKFSPDLRKTSKNLIRCFTIRNDDVLNRSGEKLLQRDLLVDSKLKTTGAKNTNVEKTYQSLLMFNSELDDENINLIRTSLTGHYLFKDMNEKIM